jgi:cell division protein FtsQ
MSEPTPPDAAVPDDTVLDELSRAFGVDDPEAFADAPRATIAIGGDDLPDAVYLDDELAKDDSSAGTVFIDDDGTSDAIGPKEATSQGIEPRIRQRRIGVRRAAGLRRLKWVGLAIAVAIVLIAVLAVLGSSLFAVEEVSVGGNVYTDPDALQEVVDDLHGTPVLLVDTDAAERRLEAIAWVEQARVSTDFPDRVTIEIRERTPVSTMRGTDGLFRVLDRDGRILDVLEGQPVALVLISGPGTLDVASGEFASIGYASASSMVLKLTPSVRARLDSIQVTADGADLRMILTRENGAPVEVRFGSAVGDTDQFDKLVLLEARLEDLDDLTVSVIDVSTA